MATKKELVKDIMKLDPGSEASEEMKHEELTNIYNGLKDAAGKNSYKYEGDVVTGFDLEDGTGVSLSPGSTLELPKNDKKVLNMVAKSLLVPIKNKN